MERKYENTEDVTDQAQMFYGIEVEHSPAHNMGTLFIVGVHTLAEVMAQVEHCNNVPKDITHIYCGANQSFRPETYEDWNAWEDMIKDLLNHNFWVTLDFDVKHAEELHESGLTEFRRFIPMVSVKLPYVSLFNYNTTIKIDDKGFEATNPGVWCHRLHDLLDTSKFTTWDKYNNDKLVK